MKIFIFGASLRKESLNQKLAVRAAEVFKSYGVQVDLAAFRDFEMPVYDGDLEDQSGQPAGARRLAERIRAADALVIATPEYNGGIPGPLKNAIDWVSREDEVPLDGKPVLLLAASPGALGGVRSLWHTRVPLEALGAQVYAEMFGLSKANASLDDEKTEARLKDLVGGFIPFAKALSQKGGSL